MINELEGEKKARVAGRLYAEDVLMADGREPDLESIFTFTFGFFYSCMVIFTIVLLFFLLYYFPFLDSGLICSLVCALYFFFFPFYFSVDLDNM